MTIVERHSGKYVSSRKVRTASGISPGICTSNAARQLIETCWEHKAVMVRAALCGLWYVCIHMYIPLQKLSLTALVCPLFSLLTIQHVDSYSHSRTSRGHPPPMSHRTSSSSRRPQSAPSHDHRRSATSSSRSHRTTGDEVYVGKYKLLKTIGKGNFAKVKLAKHMPTGQEVSCNGGYF